VIEHNNHSTIKKITNTTATFMNKNLFIGMLIALLTASCSERVKTEDFSNSDIVGIWIQDAAIPDVIKINDDGTGENSSFFSDRMNWTLDNNILIMNEISPNASSKTYIIDSIVVDTYDDKVLKGKRKMMYVRQEFLKHEGHSYDYNGWLETSRDLSESELEWLRSEEGQAWLENYNKSGDWLASETGKRWLQSADGLTWQETPAGKTYVEEKDYYHWKYVQLSEKELENL